MTIPQIGPQRPPRRPSRVARIAGVIIGALILGTAALALIALAGWLLKVTIGVWS